MQKIIAVFACHLICLIASAQIKSLPKDLFIGQNINSITTGNVTKIVYPGIKIQDSTLKEYVYKNESLLSLIPLTMLDSIILFADSKDTVRHIVIAYNFMSANYMDSLWKQMPEEKTYLEKYGMETANGEKVYYDYFLRYSNCNISIMVDLKSSKSTDKDSENKFSAILVISSKKHFFNRKVNWNNVFL